MIEEMIDGATSSIASHCAEKSGGVASPASGATSGPQFARKARTLSSAAASRVGGGSGIQRLSWKPPLVPARTSLAQALIAAGFIRSAPQLPRPPALATAIESDGGHAAAIGASRIGICRPSARAKVSARVRAGFGGAISFLRRLNIRRGDLGRVQQRKAAGNGFSLQALERPNRRTRIFFGVAAA